MADYQLRSRIPQELADELFKEIKDLQERTTGADVTVSSITRAALEQFLQNSKNEKDNKYIKIFLPIRN